MSGGHLCNYKQDLIRDIADEIKRRIKENTTPPYPDPESPWEEEINDEFYDNGGKRYDDKTILEFRNAIEALRRAYVYAKRIDWLVSGDDGEESFHRRLKEDLEELTFD